MCDLLEKTIDRMSNEFGGISADMDSADVAMKSMDSDTGVATHEVTRIVGELNYALEAITPSAIIQKLGRCAYEALYTELAELMAASKSDSCSPLSYEESASDSD
mmetsp:Transcript_26307/g.82027  ORF Transcript_26307/g.82027 Transcript_26307/m.82027 type:complete len:105 (-) Transcript_26307:268-582(-)